MELKEFIKTVLVDIVDGVKEAQTATEDSGARIVPRFSRTRYEKSQLQVVHFNIALSENSEKGTKGGIGVFLPSVALGSQGESSSSRGSLSSISFGVPVILPSTEPKD